jgi:glycosyltransferase involved in cell wall biosynthesis
MTGALEAKALAEHLSACDVLLQPYPDGISTRRGSTMAALALGLPMVTNLGHLSEEFWTDAGAVQLALSSTPQDLATCALRLIQDRDLRLQTSEIARDLYRDRFDVRHTVDALLGRSVPFNPRAAKAVA